MGNLTIKPASGGLLKLQDAGSTDRIQITDGGSTVLYEDDGNAALTIDTSGNAEFPVSVKTDTISEKTASTGVTIDGTLIKDNSIKPASGQSLVLQEDGGSAALTIDTSGNVGIGGTPSYQVDIQDNGVLGTQLRVETTYDASAGIRLESSDAGSSQIYFGDQTNNAVGRIIYNHDGDYLAFNVNASERMRIDSSGNVGIGDTTPSYQLELSTDSAAKPSTNTWTVPSDERLKEDIENADLDICYNVVKNLPLKRYKWRDDVYSTEKVRDRHKIGWIAQDVESVFPKAVNQYDFKFNKVYELDEDGMEQKLISEDVIEDCRSLNADQIYAVMFGAIQKLQTKVEALENA